MVDGVIIDRILSKPAPHSDLSRDPLLVEFRAMLGAASRELERIARVREDFNAHADRAEARRPTLSKAEREAKIAEITGDLKNLIRNSLLNEEKRIRLHLTPSLDVGKFARLGPEDAAAEYKRGVANCWNSEEKYLNHDEIKRVARLGVYCDFRRILGQASRPQLIEDAVKELEKDAFRKIAEEHIGDES